MIQWHTSSKGKARWSAKQNMWETFHLSHFLLGIHLSQVARASQHLTGQLCGPLARLGKSPATTSASRQEQSFQMKSLEKIVINPFVALSCKLVASARESIVHCLSNPSLKPLTLYERVPIRMLVHNCPSGSTPKEQYVLAWACRPPRLVEYRVLGTRPVVGQVLAWVKGSALAVDTARLSFFWLK